MKLKEEILLLKKYSYKENITLFLFLVLALFPILPPAAQSICLGVFCGIAIFFFSNNFISNLKNSNKIYWFFVLTGYYIFSLISYFWSENKIQFWNEIQPNLVLLILPFIFIFFLNNLVNKHSNYFFYVLSLSQGIYMVNYYKYLIENISLFQKIALKTQPLNTISLFSQIKFLILSFFNQGFQGLNWMAQEGSFYNKSILFFNHYVYTSSISLILICFYLFSRNNNLNKYFNFFLIIINTFFILYLDSKINKLLVLSFLFFFGIWYIKKYIKIKYLVIITISLFIIYIMKNNVQIVNLIKNITFFENKFNDIEHLVVIDVFRNHAYTSAFKSIKQNLLFGVGIGDCFEVLNTNIKHINIPIKGILGVDYKINTHSQYLFYIHSTGVIGLILFSFYYISMYIKSVSTNNCFLFSIITIICINCLFENFLGRFWGAFISIISILLNLNISNNDGQISK
jgi:hypothetical protein